MKLFNDGLSPGLFAAIKRHRESYERTGYLSTTSCLNSPRQRVLAERHGKEMVFPASRYMKSFLGSCVHSEIERYEGNFEIDGVAIEKEFWIDIGGVRFSGRPDWYSLHDEEVGDYKTTSVGNYLANPRGKSEHIMQANINGYLIRKWNYPCASGWVELIFMDWKMRRALTDRGYPREAETIMVPDLMSDADVESFILGRIAMHLEGDKLTDNELPLCTAADKWRQPDVWAVSKKGSKRAIRGGLCKSLEAAEALQKDMGRRSHKIEERPGENTRCDFYCDAQQWCNQYKEEKMNG